LRKEAPKQLKFKGKGYEVFHLVPLLEEKRMLLTNVAAN